MRRILPIAVVAALVPFEAYAQGAAVIDQMVTSYQTAMGSWEGALQRLALGTFGILAVIEIAWTLARQAMRGGAGLSDYVECLISEVMYLGMFGWLITAYTTWNPLIIQSFRFAAGQASGLQLLTPGNVFGTGVDIFIRIMNKITILDPGPSIALAICGLAVIITFALIVATMVLALLQGYFIAGAGVLFLAAGGHRISQELAMSVIRTTIGIGARLFALQLIASVGVNFIQQWLAQFNTIDISTVGIMIAQAIVLLVISWQIPNMLERMVGGTGFAHGGAVFGAAAGIASGVATASRATGTAATAIGNSGARLGAGFAAAQTSMAGRMAAGSAPQNAALRMASIAGNTLANAMTNGGNQIGSRLTGRANVRARGP